MTTNINNHSKVSTPYTWTSQDKSDAGLIIFLAAFGAAFWILAAECHISGLMAVGAMFHLFTVTAIVIRAIEKIDDYRQNRRLTKSLQENSTKAGSIISPPARKVKNYAYFEKL